MCFYTRHRHDCCGRDELFFSSFCAAATVTLLFECTLIIIVAYTSSSPPTSPSSTGVHIRCFCGSSRGRSVSACTSWQGLTEECNLSDTDGLNNAMEYYEPIASQDATAVDTKVEVPPIAEDTTEMESSLEVESRYLDGWPNMFGTVRFSGSAPVSDTLFRPGNEKDVISFPGPQHSLASKKDNQPDQEKYASGCLPEITIPPLPPIAHFMPSLSSSTPFFSFPVPTSSTSAPFPVISAHSKLGLRRALVYTPHQHAPWIAWWCSTPAYTRYTSLEAAGKRAMVYWGDRARGGKARTGKVWKHFVQAAEEDGKAGVVCVHCGQWLAHPDTNTKASTTGPMTHHLQRSRRCKGKEA